MNKNEVDVLTVLKATATELHLCQRCPRLLAYLKNGRQNAWAVGIRGSNISYGKLFHKAITGAFHASAASPDSPQRAALAEVFQDASSDLNLKERLEKMVRTYYFNPFLANNSAKLLDKQIMALAKATDLWVGYLANFLSCIPSLFASPEKCMGKVFHQPEKTLYATYLYPDGQTLLVSGRYDGLLFNPDATETVLFEFKCFESSDVTVELSQTLVYAWLVFVATSIVPSIKLIYLEDEAPIDVVASDVKTMMNNLPPLFRVTRQVLEKRLPLPVAADSFLCRDCPYDAQCDKDWGERHASKAPSSPVPKTEP
ncbi:MAG: PD-(D/E)XK nuclease family protein [Synergistaceae bacterium]|jgi:hypothetical protein|nr:PD-(D/E)XK nuclease family protein [Synergistaceae bacterium]